LDIDGNFLIVLTFHDACNDVFYYFFFASLFSIQVMLLTLIHRLFLILLLDLVTWFSFDILTSLAGHLCYPCFLGFHHFLLIAFNFAINIPSNMKEIQNLSGGITGHRDSELIWWHPWPVQQLLFDFFFLITILEILISHGSNSL
jgi:hypothetical protein